MMETWITLYEKLYLRNFETQLNAKSQLKLIQIWYLLLLNIKFAHHGKYGNCTTLKPEQIRCKFRGLNLNKICSLATSQQALTKWAAFVYFLYSLSIHQLYTLAISEVSSILFVYSNQMIPLTHFGVYIFCILHDHHLYKKYTNLCETPWPFQMMYTFCILHGLGHTKSIHSLKMIQLWWIWSIKKYTLTKSLSYSTSKVYKKYTKQCHAQFGW